MRSRTLLGTGALLCSLACGAAAQVTGLPVWNGGAARGLTLAAEIGFPSQDYGDGTAYGFRGLYGVGRWGFAGVISRYDVADPFPNQTGLGASVSWRLHGRPMLGPSATLQAGAEYFGLENGSKLHFPIGLGLAIGVPTRRVVFRPWIAPRLDLFRNSFDSPAHTETAFGLSGGVTLTGRRGFGLTFAVDRTFTSDQAFGAKDFAPMTFAAGVQYHFGRPRMRSN